MMFREKANVKRWIRCCIAVFILLVFAGGVHASTRFAGVATMKFDNGENVGTRTKWEESGSGRGKRWKSFEPSTIYLGDRIGIGSESTILQTSHEMFRFNALAGQVFNLGYIRAYVTRELAAGLVDEVHVVGDLYLNRPRIEGIEFSMRAVDLLEAAKTGKPMLLDEVQKIDGEAYRVELRVTASDMVAASTFFEKGQKPVWKECLVQAKLVCVGGEKVVDTAWGTIGVSLILVFVFAVAVTYMALRVLPGKERGMEE